MAAPAFATSGFNGAKDSASKQTIKVASKSTNPNDGPGAYKLGN